MDRGAWQATVHEVTKSCTWLSIHTHPVPTNSPECTPMAHTLLPSLPDTLLPWRLGTNPPGASWLSSSDGRADPEAAGVQASRQRHQEVKPHRGRPP